MRCWGDHHRAKLVCKYLESGFEEDLGSKIQLLQVIGHLLDLHLQGDGGSLVPADVVGGASQRY